MIDITDGIVHILLVAFSAVVLLISLLAYADRKNSRFFFLCLAFAFLAASEVVGLIEAWFFSTQLVFIPSTGIHLSHFLEFLMLASFGLALLVKN
jgi:hypothetical protein